MSDFAIDTTSSLVVFAENKTEMMESQLNMVHWADSKLMEARMNLEDIEVNLEQARANKWHLRGWQTQKRIAVKKVDFYEKILAALEAGYVIVPDFPIDVFAVRTMKHYPDSQRFETKNYWADTDRTQHSEAPPSGDGRYVGNLPTVSQNQKKDAKGETVYVTCSEDFKDVDFPIKLVKPVVLDKTGKALALKIFDEVGICPPKPKGKDPMVIGQVIYRQGGEIRKTVSFLIAWWLRASDIEV